MKFTTAAATLIGFTAMLSNAIAQAPLNITVQTVQPAGKVSPTLNGVFFEDINFGADGGLYPQRVKNGSFEFVPDAIAGWHKLERGGSNGSIGIESDKPLNTINPNYLRITVVDPGDGFGVSNEGYRDMGFGENQKFTFSVYARQVGNDPVTLDIELTGDREMKLGQATLQGFTGEWKKYTATIVSGQTFLHGKMNILVRGKGTIDLEAVSLMPVDTYNNRPNGLRPDLVQLLKDMKPKFMRFPGGCIVEGRVLSNMYPWKNTIADVTERKVMVNRWNSEFKHRLTPDYFQSFGLGFFEFFQLCEDIGAKPLPIMNCGMACQYNTGELVPLDQLDPYIQNVLDLIEFANGPVDSTWGKKRAEMGHPAPFNLDRVGIGNEQWGPRYFERYEIFAKAVKAKYPDIKLVSGSGPSPDGTRFDEAWKRLIDLNAEVIDEHYYSKFDWFLNNTHRYDNYNRKGPHVFAGEFASMSVNVGSPDNRNTWNCGLVEAAFMTGLERNSDVVDMASYAPLFAHVDAWQWKPDLIWFDNLHSFGTPSYYVQKLFSTQIGTSIIPLKADMPKDVYASATKDDSTGDVIIKIVNTSNAVKSVNFDFGKLNLKSATGWLLTGDLRAENSLVDPEHVSPKDEKIEVKGNGISHDLPAYSLTVIRVATGS